MQVCCICRSNLVSWKRAFAYAKTNRRSSYPVSFCAELTEKMRNYIAFTNSEKTLYSKHSKEPLKINFFIFLFCFEMNVDFGKVEKWRHNKSMTGVSLEFSQVNLFYLCFILLHSSSLLCIKSKN